MTTRKPMLINELSEESRVVKENFQRLEDWLGQEIITNAGWRLIQLTFKSDGTFSIPHGQNFVPSDIIQTSIKGTGAATIDYDETDGQNIFITTSGTSPADPLILRLLIGRIGGST